MKKLSETLKDQGIEFTFPIKINDANGKKTYYENSNGYWWKREYDSSGKETYHEDSTDFWWKREYDSSGNETYFENSNGDKKGTPKSAKNCDGKVVEVDGIKYELKAL